MSAIGQTAVPSKVAIIDSNTFYDGKLGIKKLSIEFQKLDAEFKPVNDQLQTMADKLAKLETEMRAMQESQSKGVPVDPGAFQAKATEYEKLQREAKYKEDDAKAAFTKRRAELLQPVMTDIGNKIGDFAKQRGFDLVLDADKLYSSGSMLYLNESIDITKAFITYYNALPPGSASVK